jgi:hypothetical protein
MEQEKWSLIDEDTEFRRYYNQHLEPLEQRFESLRQQVVKERNLRFTAALVAWLVAIGGVFYLAQPIGELWPFVAFFGLVSAVGLGMWVWLPAGAHELRLQEQVLARIVPFFGDLHYQSEPSLAPGRYNDWKVLPYFSKVYSEDQIEGSYRDVPLNLAEVRLKYESRSRTSNGKSLKVAFEGLMIVFELGQEYPGVTLIRSRGSDMHGRFNLDEALEEVGTGSEFEVFATSDAPGTALADTSFLERLAAVSAQFKTRQLFASFHADRLVMLIDHKGDFFEMSHRQQTDFARDAERVRDQLGQLFAIVDLLQLRGPSPEDETDTATFETPVFPQLPDSEAADPYDIGGWGCLGAFVLFAISMSAYLWLLDPRLSKGAMLWWSAFGGLLMALAIYQAVRAVLRRSIGAAIFGFILLAGAFSVLYFNVSSDTQGMIRFWVPGL